MPLPTAVLSGTKEIYSIGQDTSIFARMSGNSPYFEGIAVWALEAAPMKTKIKYRSGEGNIVQYEIETPWMYFVAKIYRNDTIDLHRTSIWFAQNKAQSLDMPVKMPCLPNIMKNGCICHGEYRPRQSCPVEEQVKEAFRNFWEAPFNRTAWPGKKLLPHGYARPEWLNNSQGNVLRGAEFMFENWVKFLRENRPIRWRAFRNRYSYKTLRDAMRYILGASPRSQGEIMEEVI